MLKGLKRKKFTLLKTEQKSHSDSGLKILHLSENDHVVCKPTKERNDGGWGYDEYISHADLYAGGYLKDDKLVFCVSDIVVRSK